MTCSGNASGASITAESGREFAAFPIALLAYLLDARRRFLLMRRPNRERWEIPAGVLEQGESPETGVQRELREELGEQVDFSLLTPVHAVPIRFDSNIPVLVSLGFLIRYHEGEILPGDDMQGAEYEWWSVDTILARTDIEVPNNLNHFRRALTLSQHFNS